MIRRYLASLCKGKLNRQLWIEDVAIGVSVDNSRQFWIISRSCQFEGGYFAWAENQERPIYPLAGYLGHLNGLSAYRFLQSVDVLTGQDSIGDHFLH